jgi:two-component system chemotaxis response regulator CheB
LVIDDSPTARRRLTTLFTAAGDFDVTAAVGSSSEALRALDEEVPDVISLDVYLGHESAADLVKAILTRRKIPIVLVSDAPRNVGEVFEGLAAGAVELVGKPRSGDAVQEQAFLRLMRTLSRVRLAHLKAARRPMEVSLVCLAASTGGPTAVRDFLSVLPRNFPAPIVLAQHLASGFEEGLAEWLSHASALPVKVARAGQVPQPGEVALIPSGHDGAIGAGCKMEITPAPKMGYHPSADLLIGTATAILGRSVAAVILTGIGSDGLEGARLLFDAGGFILAQDQASSAVWGMPGAVTQAGLISAVGPPSDLGSVLAEFVTSHEARARFQRRRR